MAQTGYSVYLHGRKVDTVFYSEYDSAEEVRRSLIDHDGYNPAIRVVKERGR